MKYGIFLLAASAFLYTSNVSAVLPNPTTNQTQVVTQVQAVDAPTQAQISVTMQPAIYAFLVRQNEQGQEVLIPVTQDTTVTKEDVIEYQAYFTNTGQDRIRKTTVALNIPEGVELVGSVSPVGAQATINGVDFGRMPLRANMGGEVKELPLSYYKGLRWNIENVGINGTAVVKYRAKLK
ncbi:MAG: hypothetical protein Q4C68_01770 [Moraxella sp.]|nr:hypothetical protein [Moraxella sp.]